MRIGVLGGTFDPLHRGHVTIAEAALAHLQLDVVRLVPCRRPPHKERADLTHGAERLAMVALGTQDHPQLLDHLPGHLDELSVKFRDHIGGAWSLSDHGDFTDGISNIVDRANILTARMHSDGAAQ